MMTDTTIYGYYISDVGATCAACWNRSPGYDGGNSGIYPLYSVEDDGNGLTCDDCFEFIFEPWIDLIEVASDWDIALGYGWEYSNVPDTVEVTTGPMTEFVDADVRQVDTDYGYGFGAFVGDELVAVFASPDSGGYPDLG